MKPLNISYILSSGLAAAALLCGCESHEIEMPANPAAPVIGAEVNSQVIYQANPRLFANNDCLNAITARIDAIRDMGCDILWIMPVCDPGRDATSFGSPYCIRDFKAINEKYGSVADLKNLVDKAHTAGMKVILDWVANHTSRDNVWTVSHPEYYVRDAAGNFQQANVWTDVIQLDFTNEDTAEAMIDAMRYWIDKTGIDGFRCDYADGATPDFWASLNDRFHRDYPGILMLGESAKSEIYSQGFDMIYDWNFSSRLSDTFTGGKPAELFKYAGQSWAEVPEGKNILRYVFNHDVAAENDISRMFGSIDALPAAYVLSAFLHGTPMIYAPMESTLSAGTVNFINYAPLTWDADRHVAYKAINKAYKASAETRRGDLSTYAESDVAMFTRSIPGHTLFVMVNTSADEKTVKIPIVLSGAKMTDLLNGQETTLPVTMTVPGYGYSILMN